MLGDPHTNDKNHMSGDALPLSLKKLRQRQFKELCIVCGHAPRRRRESHTRRPRNASTPYNLQNFRPRRQTAEYAVTWESSRNLLGTKLKRRIFVLGQPSALHWTVI